MRTAVSVCVQLAALIACAAPLPAQDPPAQDPVQSVRAVRTYLEQNDGAALAELRDLLAIPNLASDLPNIRRNAEALVRMLARRGAKTRILETGAAPLVYGEIGDPSLPTILFYCHYDGQPVDPSAWAQPDPWNPVLRTGALESGGREVSRWPAPGEPVPREWRVYARSASDDKAPIVALLHILDAWRAAGMEPPNRLKFLFEGDEEAGSRFLPRIAGEHGDLLAADLAIMADGPIHPSGRPTAVFGLRGIVTVTVTVYGPIRPLHSGHYGNWAPNPAMRLAQLLTSMKGPNGEVLIDGWEEDVTPLGAAERAALARYPDDDDAQRSEFNLGSLDGGGAKRIELITRPSLNVRGLRALFTGSQARTLIPDIAVAELDLRLVAGNTPERQVEKLVRHIERQGYQVVREDPDSALRVNAPRLARVEVRDGYPAGRTSLEHAAARALVTALSGAGLGEPVVIPTMGGSGPAYVFTEILNMPFAALPVVNHDNNQHAENENLRLANLFQGMEILAAAAAARLRD